MKSFIVTFYRHDRKEDSENVVGTIEEAGVSGEKKFTSMTELYGYLERGKDGKEKTKKRERSEEGM